MQWQEIKQIDHGTETRIIQTEKSLTFLMFIALLRSDIRSGYS